MYLARLNKYGTFERFTDDKGGQEYENNIILDHLPEGEPTKWELLGSGLNKHPHFDSFDKNANSRKPNFCEILQIQNKEK